MNSLMTNVWRTLLTAALMVSASACGSNDSVTLIDSEAAAEDVVHISAEARVEFGIAVDTAGPGILETVIKTPGEVVLNRDRLAHVVPRVSGVVKYVSKSVGDRVAVGEVLAVLDSRELADVKAEYLGGLERADLAEATFAREERLFEQRISSEQEYLESKQALAEARIALRSARQKLLALGFEDGYIAGLPDLQEHDMVHFELTAPIGGVIIERHVSQGESLAADGDAFLVADLSTVWVDLSVFQRDLDLVAEGQTVRFGTARGRLRGEGRIGFVRPIVGEDTRTAIARIVLKNADGRWRPGIFVDATIVVGTREVGIAVPSSAVIQVNDQPVVFLEVEGGFEPQPVSLGAMNSDFVEITAGLRPGMRYASAGTFILKAELEKGEAESGHGH